MKKLLIILIVLSGCGAGKIVSQPPVTPKYKFTRLVLVDKDNKAQAGTIYKINR